jgi:hypothetical protein
MADGVKRDLVESILERVIDWPDEALSELFGLINQIEANVLL